MKKGGPSSEPGGFTLVETMIVLAVTGIILTSALTLVSGRQDRTRFSVAIGQVQLQLQRHINDVSNGYVPSNVNYTCIATPGTISFNASAGGLGANKDCILLGKVVQLGDGTEYGKMTYFPVAGRRLTSSGAEVTTLAETTPKAMAGSPVNLANSETLDAGLTVKEMWVGTNCSNKVNAVAFLTNLASYEVDTSSLKSGQISVDLYSVDGTQPGSSLQAAIDAVNDNNLTQVNQVQICYISGTTDQSGLVTIGGQSRSELSVTLEIMDGKTC